MFFDYKRGDHAPLAPHRASSSLKHEPDREWTAPSFTSEAKVVCKDCNEGWMNDLEAAAKPILAPMLRGKRVVLDTDAQAIVARWLTKTAMVFQRTTPRRPVPERHTRYLYDHRRPPPSCQVWIGARTAEDGGILSGIQSARLKPEAAEPAGQVFTAYLVTVGIAAFVGQLFGHDLPRFDFPWGHEGMFASAVEQIWPRSSPSSGHQSTSSVPSRTSPKTPASANTSADRSPAKGSSCVQSGPNPGPKIRESLRRDAGE